MSVQDKSASTPQPPNESRLWTFLNSNFGLFVLTSIFLSGLTWAYQEATQEIEQRKVTTESVTKLNTEISYRIRLIDNYFESECSDDSHLSPQTFADIRKIYRAEPTYQSIFPENRQKDLHLLLWEQSALLEEEKENFIDSFNAMLTFNTNLNRLEKADPSGMFYETPINLRCEVDKLIRQFSKATKPISTLFPGIDGSPTSARVSTTAPSDDC